MVTSTPFAPSFQVPTLPPEGRHLDRVNTEMSRLEKYLDDLISKEQEALRRESDLQKKRMIWPENTPRWKP